MKKLLLVLCILCLLAAPVSAGRLQASRDFAEMVIPGATLTPRGIWTIRAGQSYDYFIMARGDFDYLIQRYDHQYSQFPCWRDTYYPSRATWRADGVYVWQRHAITWLYPVRCYFSLWAVKGETRTVVDIFTLWVLPSE